jgi:hypothetical protein
VSFSAFDYTSLWGHIQALTRGQRTGPDTDRELTINTVDVNIEPAAGLDTEGLRPNIYVVKSRVLRRQDGTAQVSQVLLTFRRK